MIYQRSQDDGLNLWIFSGLIEDEDLLPQIIRFQLEVRGRQRDQRKDGLVNYLFR